MKSLDVVGTVAVIAIIVTLVYIGVTGDTELYQSSGAVLGWWASIVLLYHLLEHRKGEESKVRE